MQRLRPWVRACTVSAIIFLTAGCVGLAALEPVAAPPPQFQGDVTTDVEFLAPRAVGGRCAQRGGKAFGLPALTAMACANLNLVTMPDPCAVKPQSSYSGMLCETLRLDQAQNEAATVKLSMVEFVRPADLRRRCAERSGHSRDADLGEVVACRNSVKITVANPCLLKKRGWYANLLCHELGHANGWPANHSNAKRRGVLVQSENKIGALGAARSYRQKAMAAAKKAALERDPIQFVQDRS